MNFINFTAFLKFKAKNIEKEIGFVIKNTKFVGFLHEKGYKVYELKNFGEIKNEDRFAKSPEIIEEHLAINQYYISKVTEEIKKFVDNLPEDFFENIEKVYFFDVSNNGSSNYFLKIDNNELLSEMLKTKRPLKIKYNNNFYLSNFSQEIKSSLTLNKKEKEKIKYVVSLLRDQSAIYFYYITCKLLDSNLNIKFFHLNGRILTKEDIKKWAKLRLLTEIYHILY